MKKQLYLFFLLLFPLCYIEAKQRSPFRLENDSILRICSNVQERYYEDMYSSCVGMPFYYTSVVIDEGVDSAWVYIPNPCYEYGSPLPVKLLSIPSSLKFFVWSGPPVEKVQLNPRNPYLRWENGALYSQDMRNLYFWHLEEKGDPIFQVPETVENIWDIPGHFSKVIIPERCKKTPNYYINCDTLIVHSTHSPECLNDYFAVSRFSYLYCLSDSAITKAMLEDLWSSEEGYRKHLDKRKIHCPNYDIRKRDTSWMRDSYRLTCVMGNGDTLVGIDTIPSGRSIQSVMIEGIADENVRFNEQDGHYRFYVATYDTLYQLPLEVFEKPEERKPKPKCSDFGEVRDSVFTIREGVDSLPYLSDRPSSFRKVIIPKSMRYMEGSITCDSVFIYSDSLYGACYDSWNCIDADYYYVENEQLYLSLKCSFMGKNRSAEVYSPNADIRKRDLSVQKNTNPPIWKDEQGNVIDLSNLRHINFWQFSQLTIEGIEPGKLWVFYEWKDRKYMMKYRWKKEEDGSGKCLWWVPTSYGDLELEYAVRTYDTLLTLPQKTQVRIVKQDGSPWEGDFSPTSCLYYVPKGETCESLMKSGKKIMCWKSGDTIPRRYLKRLALGLLYKNGECGPMGGRISYCLDWKDNRNYLYNSGIYFSHLEDLTPNNPFVQIPPNHPKEVWMLDISQLNADCLKRIWSPIHFYVGR
ncbi:MAG: hypothetical protein VZQ98_04290 [Bacteroidales bacterium]|nr:hypothetical protein [Bacteroidales bacterium]